MRSFYPKFSEKTHFDFFFPPHVQNPELLTPWGIRGNITISTCTVMNYASGTLYVFNTLLDTMRAYKRVRGSLVFVAGVLINAQSFSNRILNGFPKIVLFTRREIRD